MAKKEEKKLYELASNPGCEMCGRQCKYNGATAAPWFPSSAPDTLLACNSHRIETGTIRLKKTKKEIIGVESYR